MTLSLDKLRGCHHSKSRASTAMSPIKFGGGRPHLWIVAIVTFFFRGWKWEVAFLLSNESYTPTLHLPPSRSHRQLDYDSENHARSQRCPAILQNNG